MQLTDIAEKMMGKSSAFQRRLTVGAEPLPQGGTHFRVWAPDRKKVEVVLIERDHVAPCELQPDPDGYFAGIAAETAEGTLYKYRLDDKEEFPDPASRFQPAGPHGPSQVVDPSRFQWTDKDWPGVDIRGQVIYELHIGTFTPEGTYEAAIAKLPYLKEIGVTVIEVMPVADFPGRFGWGYDGVNLFAPAHIYGNPDDLRRLVDEAHKVGLAVILDVVYNHLGPNGNYLTQFSRDYFNHQHPTEWGEALNFDGPNCHGVRELYLANVEYWIREFHMDGLRLDATQAIHDSSEDHILAAIVRKVRESAEGRSCIVIGENEPQHAILIRPVEWGGYGMDALWNDDFHHSAVVALTGHKEAYYSDHLGTPQEFISAAKYGFLYQGQRYSWQKKPRGSSALGLKPASFVTFLENHDQVANSAHGARIHKLTSPGRYKAMSALYLLMPGTPMLFQGQEFLSSAPFLYFADHDGDLSRAVSEGRKEFLGQFPTLATPEMRQCFADPSDEKTFQRCKLDWSDLQKNQHALQMIKDLLALRREDPALRLQGFSKLDGAVLGSNAFLLRYFVENDQDRLLLVNLGIDLELVHAPEPLLAPPQDKIWSVIWSTEDPKYGGCGTPHPETKNGWRIPGEAALLLAPSGPSMQAKYTGNKRNSEKES